MQPITEDFLEYLYTMIAPTHLEDCCVLNIGEPDLYDFSHHEDESVHGMILAGWSGEEPEWMGEVWRVMKPGAHLMLVAPTDQPTGHTGACHVEDRGFEIRDAILLVQEAGHLHYVPKTNQAERNAGTAHLARGITGEYLWYPKSQKTEEEEEEALEALQEFFPDTDLEAGIELSSIPEDLVAQFEEGRKRGNNHPTSKPKDIMKRLLDGVPTDTVVLDPFLGSGGTALACLETGHDFVGIEMEEPYLKIADARTRHWNRELRPWDQAEISSDVDSTPKKKSISMSDLLGLN